MLWAHTEIIALMFFCIGTTTGTLLDALVFRGMFPFDVSYLYVVNLFCTYFLESKHAVCDLSLTPGAFW